MQHNFRKFFLLFCSIMLLGTVTVLVARPHTSFADEERQRMPESPATDNWQTFEDREYGFILEYPADWEVITFVEQPRPYPEPEKIVRKYAFSGPEGYVTLSVFLPQGLDLPTWLKNQNRISPDLFPAMEANARLAGYPAAAFVTGNNLILFMSSGDYIYRFWYPITDSSSALQANWHILDTFHTIAGHSRSLDADTQIPQSVVDEAQDELITVANEITNSTCGLSGPSPTCCGLTKPAGCTYQCSSRNGVERGNCTWYVCHKYGGGIPFSGNASLWWEQVPHNPGWGRGTTPRWHRNIAWWGTSYSQYGHVGFIGSYWGGTPTIQEMNYCAAGTGECVQTRQAIPHGYIYELTGGPAPATSVIEAMYYNYSVPYLNYTHYKN